MMWEKYSYDLRLIYIAIIIILLTLPQCLADCGLLKPVKANETHRDSELLKRIKPLIGKTFQVKDPVDPDKYTYKVSICGKIDGVKQPNVGAIQVARNDSCILGLYNQTDIMGGTDWMQLTYYGGEKYHPRHCNNSGRIAKIMIICDPDAEVGTFEMLEERNHVSEDYFYLFEFGSRVACVAKPKKGLSSGSVFCILFFTAILCYIVLGVLYKRIVLGAKGLEQIPNFAFWKDFGNLQADGCDFICRFGSRQESHAYRGIDDHLKDEEERDDQLLNM